MENQFIQKLAEYELRPTIIDRVNRNLVFFGFPLLSCKGEKDGKWLIQVYQKENGIERSGFPNGKREFNCSWEDRRTYHYKQGPEFEDYFYPPKPQKNNDTNQ